VTNDIVPMTVTMRGRRFVYVGDCTIHDDHPNRGWIVTREIDGDEVRVGACLTLTEAVELARGNA
jgi:hypothetical protein